MVKPTGKRHKLDWDVLSGYDNTENIPICLTQRQVMILKSALIPVYWRARWQNMTPQLLDSLDAMVSAIDNQLDGNDSECAMSLRLRERPNFECIIEQSFDGGETWHYAWNRTLCVPAVAPSEGSITNIYNDIDIIETNNTTWNFNIVNIAPQWEYVDNWTDVALCYVITIYIDWVCDWAINEIETGNVERRNENDWLDDVSAMIAAFVTGAIIAATSPVSLPALVIGALAYATVQTVEAIWDALISLSPDNYRDQDDRDAVKCFMYNQIRGHTPQFSEWSTSLDNFEGENSAQDSIALTAGLWNHVSEIYVNYMLLMEDVNSIAEMLPDLCDCPTELIIDQLAGPNGTELYGTELTTASLVSFANPGDEWSECPGVWFPENQYYYDRENPIGGVGCNVEVALPDNVLVTRVKVRWGGLRVTETSHGDKNASVWIGDPNVDGVYVAGHTWSALPSPQQFTTDQNNPEAFPDTPRTHAYFHNSMDRDNGQAYIMWIHIECVAYEP